MNTATLRSQSPGRRLADFFELCKPRVNTLIVFTAMIGMFLAAPGLPPAARFLVASLGIALVAGAAAALNCLVERTVDARMARTRGRATARGTAPALETLGLSLLMGGAGLWLLHAFINDLTLWLTLATFLGYAVIYTLVLKPATPMNIVIGGASGAMPPVLGWTAMTGSIGVEPLALFLIIFLWTPPHFWALALYRVEDYRKAGLPMLPVTHGNQFTRLMVLLYTLILFPACLMPYIYGMSSWLYLAAALLLSTGFCLYGFYLWRDYSDELARKTFRFSLLHLSLLFAALMLDHYLC